MSKLAFKKINHRVFVYTALAFILVLSVILAVQVFFFEDWYYDAKINQMIENIETYSQVLESADTGYEDIYQETEAFQENNSAEVRINEMTLNEADNEGLEYFKDMVSNYNMTIIGPDNEYYYMFFDVFEEEVDESMGGLRLGDALFVYGFLFDDTVYPIVINDTEVVDPYFLEELYEYLPENTESGSFELPDFEDGFDANFFEANGEILEFLIEEEGVVEINGEFILLEKERFSVDGMVEVINEDLFDYYDQSERVEVNESLSYFAYQKPFTNVNNVVFEKNLDIYGTNPTTIYIEVSLQNMYEMISFMMPFYVAFFIIALVMALIVAWIISRGISRPIIALDEKAKAMANMDFDTSIDVESSDELGTLAASINMMSRQLSTTLEDLQKTNQSLYTEIEKERGQEAARREFISSVSHDLKTPIGIASGYLEAIQDGIREDLKDKYLDISIKELARMNKIVLDMLEVVRLEDTNLDLEMEKQEIMTVVRETAAYFSIMAKDKDMSISLPDVSSCLAVAENRSFKSVMMNILSNAIHYGLPESIIIVDVEEIGHEVMVKVINRVEPGLILDKDKIWNKFYTKDESRNRKTSGTGLGLTIVKNVLDKYGSDFDVIAKDGYFEFRFLLSTDLEVKE